MIKENKHTPLLWANRLILGLGVALRAFHYLNNRSLWYDESLLALNFLERSREELVGPLSFSQKGPAGFLLAVDFLQETFGNSEHILRFLPFFFGVISLFLFYSLARYWLLPPAQTLILAVFAFSPLPVYYSSELKEYSTDLFCSALLLCLATAIISRKSSAFSYALVGVAVLVVWFSFPSAFVLAAIGTGFILPALARKEWKQAAFWSVAAGLWLTSFATHYYLTAAHFLSVDWPETNMASAFLPLIPHSKWELAWLYHNIPNVVLEAACGIRGWIGLFFLLSGLLAAWSRDRLMTWLMFGPFLLALISSSVYLYPMQQRFLLFAVPGLLLLIAHGWQSIWDNLSQHRRFVALIAAVCLLSYPLYESARSLFKPGREELRDVLLFVQNNKQENDLVYLYKGARPAFLYYLQSLDLKDWNWTIGAGFYYESSVEVWEESDRHLQQISNDYSRAWILFSHVHDKFGLNEEQLLLFFLNRYGEPIEEVRFNGASAYLYAFDDSAPAEGQVPAP